VTIREHFQRLIKRVTYIVICPENGNNCYAGGSRTEIQQ